MFKALKLQLMGKAEGMWVGVGHALLQSDLGDNVKPKEPFGSKQNGILSGNLGGEC